MKKIWFIILTITLVPSCTYNTTNPLQKRVESQEELKLRLLNESKLQRPELKGYMLDSKRPYLYNQVGYVDFTTVAGLPGKIKIVFDKDSLIKIITFTYEFFENEILEYNKFVNLINEKYNLDWEIDNEDRYATSDYISENDNSIFRLSREIQEIYTATEPERLFYKRKLNKLIKEKRKDGLYRWEIDEIDKMKRDISFKLNDFRTRYIFRIADKYFVQQQILQKEKNKILREQRKIEYEKKKIQQEKEKLLDDF